MTPKEAIQTIQDNLTPRTLGILTVEFNVVEKALDSLELLKEKAKKYDEILNLKTTPNVIEKSLADFMNKCIALEKENEKLEKVITWLKNTFEITLDSKVRISDGIDCIQAFPIDLKTNEVIYDLLKEVLENV